MKHTRSMNDRAYSLYLTFKKTYVLLKINLVEAIETGNGEAAEQYEVLENTWKRVEAWYAKQNKQDDAKLVSTLARAYEATT